MRRSFGLSDIGLKRKINQDAYFKDDNLGLYIIADGMGGHLGGEVASRLAIETIYRYCLENKSKSCREKLYDSINLSSNEIFKSASQNTDLTGMGTTVTVLLFDSNNTAYIGHVGDSRAYLIRGRDIWQLTEDHSLLNEEVKAGRVSINQIENYQFKNVITRSVGYQETVIVDIYKREVSKGDIYLLCTDGLSGLVESSEIANEVATNGIEKAISRLIDLANQRGGDDNITVVIVEVGDDGKDTSLKDTVS